MHLLFFLIFINLINPKNSNEKPDWINKKPINNSDFNYYIGRSSSLSSESEAFNFAYQNALEQAIKENFGIVTKIDTQSYSTLSETISVKKTSDVSQQVEIKEFELVEYYVEKLKNDKYNVWCLYKYAKSAILSEKIRLVELKKGKEKIDFWDAGLFDIKQKNNQVVEVVTVPSGADVYINGAKLSGSTPLKIQLPVGTHQIQIDHNSYDTITETLIITGGGVKRQEFNLIPARSNLRIITEPTEARVFIEGRYVGLTPIENIFAKVDETLLLQIEHPEAEKYTQTVTLKKGSSRVINQKLPLKPARILISTEPIEGVDVFINEEKKGRTPIKNGLILDAGNYKIKFVKDGFIDKTIDFSIKGDETKFLEPVIMGEMTNVLTSTSDVKLKEVNKNVIKDSQVFGDFSSFTLTERSQFNMVSTRYTPYEGFIFNGSIQKNDLFGSGEKIIFYASTNSLKNVLRVSIFDSSIFDSEWGSGIDIYRTLTYFSGYYTRAFGSQLKIEHSIGAFTKALITYKIEDQTTLWNEKLNAYFSEEKDNGVTSSSIFSIVRDERDDSLSPKKGGYDEVSFEVAGFGGDNNFYRLILDKRYYQPIIWDLIFRAKLMYGLVRPYNNQELPNIEKFFLGGIDTLRGYDYSSIGSNVVASDGNLYILGGTNQIIFNSELEFPLIPETNINGVLFFDAGDAYNNGVYTNMILRFDWGFGVRWFSRVGLFRFECGFPIEKREFESDKVIHFQYMFLF